MEVEECLQSSALGLKARQLVVGSVHISPTSRPSIRQHRRHLNLHLRPRLHQRGDLHARHGGEVAAHDFAVGGAEFFEAGVVLDAVGDVPGHADHVLRPGSGFMQHGGDVAQRLRGLGDEVLGLKLLLGIPADLAADKNLNAARGDAIGVAFGGGPPGRLENRHMFAGQIFSAVLNFLKGLWERPSALSPTD